METERVAVIGGALLAAGVAAAAAVVIYRRRIRAVLVPLAVAAGLSGAWVATHPDQFGHLVDFGGTSGRVTQWRVAWRIAEERPLLGTGVNNYRAVAPRHVREPGALTDVEQIVDRPHVVHNVYLQLLAETGIVGLVLFLIVAGACLRAAQRAARRFEREGRA